MTQFNLHSQGNNSFTDYFWYLRYFWLNKKFKQTYFIPISTCRYPNQLIRINIYPNIKWELTLSYNYNNPLGFNHGNLTTYPIEGIIKKYDGLAKQDYTLSSESSVLGKFKLKLSNPKIDDETLPKIEIEFAEKIRKVCAFFYKMKKIADKVAYGTEEGANILRKKKFPFEFEIKSPSTGIKASWGFEQTKSIRNNNEVELNGTLDLFASPIIGAELTLKIHELVKYIPHPIGKILDGIITGINSLKSDNLTTKFEINLKFTGSLNANIQALKLNLIDDLSISENVSNKKSYIEGEFKVKLEIIMLGKGNISIPWTKYEFNFGGKAEASLTAYWDAKLHLSNQEKGLFGQFSGGFSGLKGKIIVEIYVGGITFTVFNEEGTWLKPDDANTQSDITKDEGQQPLIIPIIESSL